MGSWNAWAPFLSVWNFRKSSRHLLILYKVQELVEYLILTCLVAPQLQKVVVRGGFEEDGPSPLSSIMRMPDKELLCFLRFLELLRQPR